MVPVPPPNGPDAAPGHGSVQTDHAEHFARRLESFTDLVFGFSLSFLAGRLIVPAHAEDLFTQPAPLLGFAFTFASIAFIWFISHRTFRQFYSPTPIDTLLVFVELFAVALLPYALSVALHFYFLAPSVVIFYDLVYGTIMASNALISYRGFRRHAPRWDPTTRGHRWRGVVAQTTVAGVFAVDALVAPHSIPASVILYWLIWPFVFLTMRVFRRPPRSAQTSAHEPD
jgi:uncharacterized membrane protein